MTKRKPELQQFPLSANSAFLDPDTHTHTETHISTLPFTAHTQTCLISGSHHIRITEKLMVDRGQALPDWLASFKKERSTEKTAQPTRWVASPSTRSQYLVNSFELNRVKNHSSASATAYISPLPPRTHVFMYSSFPRSLLSPTKCFQRWSP